MAARKTQAAFVAYVECRLREFRDILCLNHYAIRVAESAREKDGFSSFTVKMGSPQQCLWIDWHSSDYEAWVDGQTGRVDHDLLHELVHAIVRPLAELSYERFTCAREIETAEETVVDHLTNVLHRLLATEGGEK